MSPTTIPRHHPGQALYRASASTTSRLLANHTWSILYGDRSSARGVVYRDDVTRMSLFPQAPPVSFH